MPKRFSVQGEEFDVGCDASEHSYQLCRRIYVNHNDVDGLDLHLRKFGDKSWGVYDRKNRQWYFTAKVEVI